MQASLLGPSYTNEEVEEFLKAKDAPYIMLNDEILLVLLSMGGAITSSEQSEVRARTFVFTGLASWREEIISRKAATGAKAKSVTAYRSLLIAAMLTADY